MDDKSLIYQFDDVHVDLEKFEVVKAESRVRIEPKAFEVLVFLIENRGRLVEKKELLDAVWKDAFVTENAMTRIIAQLRKALGDDSKEAKYIETVPTRGYRFIAEVKERVEPDDEKAIQPANPSGDREESQGESSVDAQVANASVTPLVQPDTKSRGRVGSRRALVLVICTMIVGLAVALSYFWILRKSKPSSDGAAIRSIAVLPFKPLVAESHNEYLEMGIADALISKLGSIREIEVRPISAVRKYTDPEQDAVAIGKTLEVDAVLDSSIQMVGDQTRVRTQLVRVTDGKQIWRFECDDKCAGIFDVQDSISEQIISALTLTLTAEEAAALTKRYTNDTETYRLYLTGRLFLNKRTPDSLKKAIDYFQQAIAREPKYAPAYSGLADCYIVLVNYVGSITPREGMPKARDAAAKAVEVDDKLAEGHASLGLVRLFYDLDFSGAEKEFKLSIELNPNYGVAHVYYAFYLSAIGRHDDAIREVTLAAELDPTSTRILDLAQLHFYLARRYDEALEQSRKLHELDSNASMDVQVEAYRQKGMFEEALAGFLESLRRDGVSSQVIESLRNASETGGPRAFWQKYIKWLEDSEKRGFHSPIVMAIAYAAVDEKDKAFAQLEKMYDERDGAHLIMLKRDPDWDNLRSDPRFDDLVRRVGIP